ncbi:hypothetical protein [Terribacillus saccharophilus]|uniref:hypothetical protein n=1 Tax=Terribacillus saccharophilus TaxID=361277 RepID=UPI0039823D2F
MSAIDWFILGVILVGILIWIISGRVFYMLIYFALFSLGSFIYRLSNDHSFSDALSSLGLVDIFVLVIALVLLIDKLKDNKN